MDWYQPLIKKAKQEIGHGDTLEGQMLKQELTRLTKEIDRLRTMAATGGPDDVLPRWKGEIRHKILLLPASDIMPRMSMYELKALSSQIDGIHETMKTYSASRFKEIIGNANNSGNKQPKQ